MTKPDAVDRVLAMALARDATSKGSSTSRKLSMMLRAAIVELYDYDERLRKVDAEFRELSGTAERQVLSLREVRFERDRRQIAYDQALAMIDRLVAYCVDPAWMTDEIRDEIAILKSGFSGERPIVTEGGG